MWSAESGIFEEPHKSPPPRALIKPWLYAPLHAYSARSIRSYDYSDVTAAARNRSADVIDTYRAANGLGRAEEPSWLSMGDNSEEQKRKKNIANAQIYS